MARTVRRNLATLQAAAGRLADGDLTGSTGLDQDDEIGRTAKSLDEAMVSLRSVLSAVGASADAVAASSEELSASSAQISASARGDLGPVGCRRPAPRRRSRRNVQTVAAGAEQMGASIREIASNAAEASEVAAKAVDRRRDDERHGRQAR